MKRFNQKSEKASCRPLVNVPPGLKLLICMLLAACAFAARTYTLLAMLLLTDAVMFILFCGIAVSIRRELKLLLWQTVMIAGLYVIRFGIAEGILPGVRTSLQLFLAFFPGVIFIKSTSHHSIIRSLSRILPYRMAFVLATSIMFIPMVIKELRDIYEIQVLRGARILPKDLIKPLNWPDVINCMMIPAVVRAMALAGEIAMAAQARDFGINNKRTCWPGE